MSETSSLQFRARRRFNAAISHPHTVGADQLDHREDNPDNRKPDKNTEQERT
jgi:hypothetical protein